MVVEHRVVDDEPGALAGELGVVEGRLVRAGANDAAQHEVVGEVAAYPEGADAQRQDVVGWRVQGDLSEGHGPVLAVILVRESDLEVFVQPFLPIPRTYL